MTICKQLDYFQGILHTNEDQKHKHLKKVCLLPSCLYFRPIKLSILLQGAMMFDEIPDGEESLWN